MTAEAWLRDYRMDGLRFDSIKDVPMDMVQVRRLVLLVTSLPCYVVPLFLCRLPACYALYVLILYVFVCVAACCCSQEVTWALKQRYPGRFLSAEITPEDPQLMAQYGFDAIWVHSGEASSVMTHAAAGTLAMSSECECTSTAARDAWPGQY
jgi:hypothetical protein